MNVITEDIQSFEDRISSIEDFIANTPTQTDAEFDANINLLLSLYDNLDKRIKVRDVLSVEQLNIRVQEDLQAKEDLSNLIVKVNEDLDKRKVTEEEQDRISKEIQDRLNKTKEESDRLTGRGLESVVLGNRPNTIDTLLKKRGDVIISQIAVCRVPINPVIKKIINILSLGKLEKERKKRGYDDVFHLYLEVSLLSGDRFAIEKNEIVSVSRNLNREGGDCKIKNVMGMGVTLNKMILPAEKRHGKNFYRYDARTYNCQDFVMNLLHEVRITEFDDFIYQDFTDAISTPLREIAGKLTDFQASISLLFNDSIKIN